jgi:hypothetical protein
LDTHEYVCIYEEENICISMIPERKKENSDELPGEKEPAGQE